jgi:hypothetical protein
MRKGVRIEAGCAVPARTESVSHAFGQAVFRTGAQARLQASKWLTGKWLKIGWKLRPVRRMRDKRIESVQYQCSGGQWWAFGSSYKNGTSGVYSI